MTKRGMPKPIAIIIAVLMGLYFVPLGALPASANATGNKLVGGFEIDGNFPSGNMTPAGDDWSTFPPQPVGVDPVGAADTSNFSQGTKECTPQGDCTPNGWAGGTGTASPKDDISNIFEADRVYQGDLWGYFGVQRQSANGTTHYVFELNQLANHTNPNGISVPTRSLGDLRITVEQQGQGDFTVAAAFEKWTTTQADCASGLNAPCWTDPTPISSDDFYGLSNDATIPGFGGTGTVAEGQFVELAINLSAAGATLGCPSSGFVGMNVRTRESESDTAAIKDYGFAPIDIPSNCSQFKIEKHKGNASGPLLAGATFSISPNPLSGQTTPDPLNVTDGGTNDADGTANGVVLIDPAKPGTYSVTEVTPPLGYIKETGSKSVTAQPFAETPAVVVFSNDHGSVTWQKVDGTSLDPVCCATFEVKGTGGAAQTLNIDVTVKDNDAPDADATAGSLKLTDLPTGDYSITETNAPAGYDLPSVTTKTFTIDAAHKNVTVPTAFADPRKTPDVSAIKHDTSVDGATLPGAGFTLYLDNGTTKGSLDAGDTVVPDGTYGDNPQTTGANGLATWTDLGWGDYLIVETAAPTGYTLPVPNPVQAFTVNRDNAGDNSRVFNFNDPRSPTTITVTKTDEAGKAILSAPAQFGLYADLNHDGIWNDNEPLVSPTPELNPQWTTIDGTQNATVDGTVSWSNLDFGYYVVHELQAPQGYVLPVALADRDVAFHVTAANAGGTLSGSVADPKMTTRLKVLKTDEAGAPLAGATFQLWQETNNTTGLQTGGTADSELGDCTTDASGLCTLPKDSDSFKVTWPNTYYWVEITPPAGYSLPDVADRVQQVDVTQATISQPFPATQFKDPKPAIVTHASSTDLPDGTVTDYADLGGVADDATGTLHFALYGPYADGSLTGSSCVDATKLVGAVADVDITGPGRYPTGQGVVSRTVTKQGVYYWYVTYDSATSNNQFGSAVSACGADNEVVTVNPATPVITTHATPSATYLAETIHDAVTVRPVTLDASGALVVSVYGPSQSTAADCTSTAAHTWTATRSADDSPGALEYTTTLVNGKYQIDWTTPEFTPTGAGNYFWKATYAGDANNLGAPAQGSNCGELSQTSHEVSHVDKAPTSITTAATESSLITPDGTDPISDELRVHYGADGVQPTGDVTLTLYGPLAGADPATSCATTPQAHQWTLHLGDGTLGTDQQGAYVTLASPDFTPTAAGTYRWATSYPGDDNYLASTGACPDPNEVSRVSKPELDKTSDPATVASTADGTPTLVPLGSTITYTLTVTNTGDAPIVNKDLVDTLPTGVTFGHVTGSTPFVTPVLGMDGHVTLTWSVSLAAGASETFTYTVTVNKDAAGGDLLVNVARFLGLEDQTTHTVGVPVATLDKSSPTDGQLVHVGDTIHYVIKVGNTGNFPITSSALVDTLPDGVTFVVDSDSSSSTGGGSVDSGPTQGTIDNHNTITWLVTLPAGSTATVEFDALVTGAVPQDANLVNKATFENLLDTTTHHTGHPGPGLDKSSPTDGQLVHVGDTIHYKIKVSNTGDYPVTSRPVVDTLPDGLTLIADSDTSSTTGGGTVDSGPTPGSVDSHNTLTWVVTLPADSSATVEYDALVTDAVPADANLVNSATFEELVDTTTHHTGHPTPTLDKSSPNEGATVPLGATIHYQVLVGNTGDYPITSSPVVDTLPVGVTYVAGSSAGTTSGGGTASAAPTTGTSGSHNTLTWTVTLPPGATATFRFDVTVNSDNPRGAVLRNTAAFENLTDQTVHFVGIPQPTLDKFANPATTNASPTIVQPGTHINYSVKVGNTGNFPITGAPVVDTLPSNVSVVSGTISDGGTLSGDGKTITWNVTLAPGASKTLTYTVTVDQAAPEGALLVNTARFENLTDTTTHVVPTGDMTLVKAVSPVAGHGVVVHFGDKLTYTLTASATGRLDQTDVVVTDYLPGRDPAHPTSGDTTYVAGSAACIGAGTCTVTGPDANGLITWHLGAMAAGSSRQVTFQVIIKDVTGPAGSTIAEDIVNQGSVRSTRTPETPSNVVVTPVSKVLPVKVGPRELPHTGATLPVGPTVGGGIVLLGLGILLLATTRRRRGALLD